MSRQKQPSAAAELTDGQILGYTPATAPKLPTVNFRLCDAALCRAVAANLPPDSLYRMDDTYLTIEHESRVDQKGETVRCLVRRPMSAARFCSWIEGHMRFRSSADPEAAAVSLNKATAEKILASDALRAAVPPIREICDVRLPVWGPEADGRRTIRLAPVGYDPATRIYTADSVPWDSSKAYPPQSIAKSLHHILHEFPWSEEEGFMRSRSVACFIAFMAGQFARHLIDRHPLVLFNANQPGSGKTLLACLGLSPTVGNPDITPFSKDDESLRKMLFSQLLAHAPYVLIDDLTTLTSPTINQFATSSTITDRLLGGNAMMRAENRMQIIGTGNNLATTQDVERRALIIDLFVREKATERDIERPLSAYLFARPAWRAGMLQALWSLTKAWADAGCPDLVKGTAMPSFESFAEVAGSITVNAGFISPFTKRETVTEGGDMRGRTLEMLLAAIAGSILPAQEGGPHTGLTMEFKVAEILETAAEQGWDDIVTTGKDKAKSLGQQLRKLRGRIFRDTLGRRFEFGRRKEAACSTYPFRIISEPMR